MKRIDFADFKKEALSNPEIQKEYNELSAAYELRKKLIKLRKDAGLTQEELATKLHTNKSNISRLENIASKNSPRLSTIEEYAHAMGYDIKIDFIPMHDSEIHNHASGT